MSAETIQPAPAETADQMLKSVGDALVEFPKAVSDQTAIVARHVTEFTQDAVVGLARVTYTGAYFMAYAAVFSALFVAQALPKQNPIMDGFEDGGKAAGEAVVKKKRAKTEG